MRRPDRTKQDKAPERSDSKLVQCGGPGHCRVLNTITKLMVAFFIVLFIIIITSNMIIRGVTLILLVGNKSAESSGPRSSGRYSLRFIRHDDREQMIIDHDDNDDNDTIPVSDLLHLGDDNCTSLMSKCYRANSGWLEIRKETNRKCILVPPSVDI